MFRVWTCPWGDISEMYLEGGAGGGITVWLQGDHMQGALKAGAA